MFQGETWFCIQIYYCREFHWCLLGVRHSETALIQPQTSLVLNMSVKDSRFAFCWPMNTVVFHFATNGWRNIGQAYRLGLFNRHKPNSVNKWEPSQWLFSHWLILVKVLKLHVSKIFPNLVYYARIYFFDIYVFLQLILMSINESLNLGKTYLNTGKIFRTLQHCIWIRTSLSAH